MLSECAHNDNELAFLLLYFFLLCLWDLYVVLLMPMHRLRLLYCKSQVRAKLEYLLVTMIKRLNFNVSLLFYVRDWYYALEFCFPVVFNVQLPVPGVGTGCHKDSQECAFLNFLSLLTFLVILIFLLCAQVPRNSSSF